LEKFKLCESFVNTVTREAALAWYRVQNDEVLANWPRHSGNGEILSAGSVSGDPNRSASPITCMDAIITASQMTGLILLGMMDEPGWSAS
jgi:hypothetical protein